MYREVKEAERNNKRRIRENENGQGRGEEGK
jgi:hypothetical protein